MHSLRVMSVIEKVMHRLNNEAEAANVSKLNHKPHRVYTVIITNRNSRPLFRILLACMGVGLNLYDTA